MVSHSDRVDVRSANHSSEPGPAILISLRHSSSDSPPKPSLSGDDAVLREILEELRWIEGSKDGAERELRLRWLGTKPISPNSRFALRRDRAGFLISFVQYGNQLHPMGWTIDRRRACAYRGLQQQKPSLLARLSQSLSNTFRLTARTKPHITAAE
jgi:hypothetical protein